MDLKLCSICGEPATYGDQLTWALCSQHYLEKNKETIQVEAQEEKPLGDSFSHQTIEGLTSIIIPIYTTGYPQFHYLGHCIGSIRYFTKLPYELIIVDNGSPIKPGRMEDYYAQKIIQNETNLGYVKAINKGIRASFGQYLALLTSDIQVYDNWLEDAQEALKHVDLVYAKPMYGEPFSRAYEANQKRDKWKDRPIEESLNNDLEDGSCLITTKKLFDTVGLLDENYFNYASDRDLFRTIEKAGLKYAGCERINIFHIIQGTGSSIENNSEQMDKDKEYYRQKWETGQNTQ